MVINAQPRISGNMLAARFGSDASAAWTTWAHARQQIAGQTVGLGLDAGIWV
jgi:hypothetical protein